MEQLAAAVEELEVQSIFEEEEETDMGERLAVAEELHRRHNTSLSLRRRS